MNDIIEPVYALLDDWPAGCALPCSAREVRRYSSPADRFDNVLAYVSSWASVNGYRTQRFLVEDGRTCIQLKSDSLIKRIFGMDLCLNVVFSQEGPDLLVEIGEGAWMSKVGVGTVGLLVGLFPFAITAGIGMYWQAQLPGKVYDEVEAVTHVA